MANAVASQIILDGNRNAQVKVTGILDTSDVTTQVIIADPASFSGMATGGAYKSTLATGFAVKAIDWSIEDGLEVRLYWGDTGGQGSNTLMEVLQGRGNMDYTKWGFMQNNTASPNGKIALLTQGWGTGQILSFTIVLWLIKQGPFG